MGLFSRSKKPKAPVKPKKKNPAKAKVEQPKAKKARSDNSISRCSSSGFKPHGNKYWVVVDSYLAS